MALKKKGTPVEIKTLTEAELATLRKLIAKAIDAGLAPIDILESKKNKS